MLQKKIQFFQPEIMNITIVKTNTAIFIWRYPAPFFFSTLNPFPQIDELGLKSWQMGSGFLSAAISSRKLSSYLVFWFPGKPIHLMNSCSSWVISYNYEQTNAYLGQGSSFVSLGSKVK